MRQAPGSSARRRMGTEGPLSAPSDCPRGDSGLRNPVHRLSRVRGVGKRETIKGRYETSIHHCFLPGMPTLRDIDDPGGEKVTSGLTGSVRRPGPPAFGRAFAGRCPGSRRPRPGVRRCAG